MHVRHAGRGQRLGARPALIVSPAAVDVGVDLVGRQPQRGQPGGGGDRVPRQRAGLVDRPLRRQPRHHVGAAAERRGGEAAAHHLAERDQVGHPALERRRRGPTGPAGDARKPVITSSLTNSAPCRLQVSARNALKPGSGGTTPMLPGAASVIEAGDPVAVLGERLLDGGPVVVGQHQRQRGRGLGYAGSAGHRERGQPGAGRGEQRVDVAVVAAGELHHHVAAGEAAGQPDRRHGRLGAGGHEPDPLHRRAGHHLLGELDLGLRRGAVRRAAGHRGGHGGLHLGVGVAQQHRPPRADQVDVLVAVDVGQPGALRGPDEPGRAADGVERADRRVHPAGRDPPGPLEQGARKRWCRATSPAHCPRGGKCPDRQPDEQTFRQYQNLG